jgi:hypothetical protein
METLKLRVNITLLYVILRKFNIANKRLLYTNFNEFNAN